MNSLHEDYIAFVSKLFEAVGEAKQAIKVGDPLEAYMRLAHCGRKGIVDRPATTDHTQPWQVYIIRNTQTGRAYVGRAAKGLAQRYPEGYWWRHHNDELSSDIALYGVVSFRLDVYQCMSSDDMCSLESTLTAAEQDPYNRVAPSSQSPCALLSIPQVTLTEEKT